MADWISGFAVGLLVGLVYSAITNKNRKIWSEVPDKLKKKMYIFSRNCLITSSYNNSVEKS